MFDYHWSKEYPAFRVEALRASFECRRALAKAAARRRHGHPWSVAYHLGRAADWRNEYAKAAEKLRRAHTADMVQTRQNGPMAEWEMEIHLPICARTNLSRLIGQDLSSPAKAEAFAALATAPDSQVMAATEEIWRLWGVCKGTWKSRPNRWDEDMVFVQEFNADSPGHILDALSATAG